MKKILCPFFIFLPTVKMENLFSECYSSKGSNIKVKTIQRYANQCEKITYGCDELKMISKGDYLKNCPCFTKINNNGTNSKDILLDCDKFQNCVFDSISVVLDCFDSFFLYKVVGVYEGKAYDLVDFKFYSLDSRKAKINDYLSDILIHGKARRLQVVSGGKFNIYDFMTDLVCYEVKHKEKFLIALEEYYITRFDFRIDFFHKNELKHLSYNDVYTFNARKDKDNLVVDKKSGKLYTGWCAGNRKDKYIYTRMYQKQIEALDKGHGELYIDYLEYPGKVRRLEFEFLSKFTTYPNKVSFGDEYIHHKLTKKVFEYLGLSEHNGYFTRPKSKIEVPFNRLSLYQKKRVITQVKNGSVKLHKAGINPFVIVNQGLRDNGFDSQILEDYFECSLWGEDYDSIIERIEQDKINIKDLYDKFLKDQLGIDQ